MADSPGASMAASRGCEAGLVEQQVRSSAIVLAGAEGHVVVGLPVDVGDVGFAADLDAGPAGDRLGADDRVAGVERLGLEVVSAAARR